jgi:hypothetical protein
VFFTITKSLFPRRISVSLVIAGLLVVMIAGMAMAQEEKLLQDSLDQMKASQVWWDDLWQKTFSPPPGAAGNDLTAYWIANIARFFVLICLPFWLYQVGTDLATAGTLPIIMKVFGRYFLFAILCISLLGNDAKMSRELSLGLRTIINNQANGLMQVQISGLSMRSALSNQLAIRAQSDKSIAKAQECAALPRPSVVLTSPDRPAADQQPPLTREQVQAYDYLDCIKAFQAQIAADTALTRQTMCGGIAGISCSIYDNWGGRLGNSAARFYASESLRYSNPNSFETLQRNGPPATGAIRGNFLHDVLIGAATSAFWVPVLNNIQWVYVSMLELALFLSGLSSPIFAAMALIPGQLNTFLGWLIVNLTIGMMKIFYILIIGAVAIILSQQNTFLLSDLRFPILIGVAAPFLATAMALSGAWAASKSFMGVITSSAGAAAGVASSGIGAIGFSLSRSLDKRR